MKSRLKNILLFISLSFFIYGCPQQSPMKMKLEVSPDSLVGKDVFAIIHIRSNKEAQHAKLEFRASEGIELLTETTEFYMELPEDQWVEYKIPFRVTEEGTSIISAYAFNSNESGSEFGFGAGITLYIKSTDDAGTVSKTKFDTLHSEAGLLMLFAGIHFFFSWLVFNDKVDISKNWSIVNIIWGFTALGSIFLINI